MISTRQDPIFVSNNQLHRFILGEIPRVRLHNLGNEKTLYPSFTSIYVGATLTVVRRFPNYLAISTQMKTLSTKSNH